MRLGVLACLLGGCHVVFGLDPVDEDDAGPGRVRGTFAGVSAPNRDHVPTVENTIFAAEEVDFDALLLDTGEHVPVDYDPVKGEVAFTRDRDDQPYRVFEAKHDIGIESSSSRFAFDKWTLGRIDRSPVTLPTTINFDTHTTPNQTGHATLFSTGLWAEVGAAEPLPSATSIDFAWKNASSVSGPLGLLVPDDDLVIAEMTGDPRVVSAAAHASIAMIDGETVSTMSTLVAVEPRCAQVQGDFEHETMRLAFADPRAFFSAGWTIRAIATLAQPFAGHDIAQSVSPSPSNSPFTIAYGTPFELPLVATLGVIAIRPGIVSDNLAVALYVGTRHYVPLDAGTCEAVFQLPSGIAFPRSMTIDGQSIDDDRGSITLDDGDPTIEFQIAAAGPHDRHSLILLEVDTATGAMTPRANISTIAQQVTMPREVFAAGKTYLVRVDLYEGFASAADGDFAKVVYPAAGSTNYSGTFSVQ